MRAVRLKTEYLINPVGIDITSPRLSWNLEGGKKQTAYQIVAADEKGNMLWDSGTVCSESMHADWKADPVSWKTRVQWSLRVTDENGQQSEPANAFFETGLPKDQPWPAAWISGNYTVSKEKRYPVDCFRKTFEANDVRKARLYITACGLYEARINGMKASDALLTPGITDYRRRIQYQTYDVTELIRNGENTIEVQLADGWYRGSCGAWGLKNQYGTETKLMAVLETESMSGTVKQIVTDDTWQWSNDGPIRFADNKDGEIVDARMAPLYESMAKVTRHDVIPSASNNALMKEQERLKADLIITPAGKKVLDFHQNIAGFIHFSLNAQSGQTIFLRFGEMLDENGEFTQKNIQCSNDKITTPLQEIRYICKEGHNEFRNTFSIFGFRYVLAESEAEINPEDFEAIAVYTDLERTGWFESSNELLNRFFENTVWSTKSNAADLPTDCPTRERHGWSGDAQIFCSTASWLFDYMAFAEKYLNDMYTWQKKNGCLPHIVPDGGADFYMNAMNGSVGWADAGVIMPYVLWKKYGDIRIVEKYINGMRRYVRFQNKRCGAFYPTAKYTGLHGMERKYLNNAGQAYGEWAEPEDVHITTWKDCAVPHPETATAYTAYINDLLAEMEAALGNEAEAETYHSFAENCRRSYQALRRKCPEYTLDTDRQARLVRPLAFHMLDAEQTAFAQQRLLQALEHYGYRIGTGFLSTPLIMDVLKEIDIEAAYRLLENEELPGWLFMPKNGATTVWEAWEGNASKSGGIASLNHYSKGAVCAWLFETMCGIHVAGENQFVIQPQPGGTFTYASASYNSVYGMVKSGWKKTENGFVYEVEIPSGCTGRITLPDGQSFLQEAGRMQYGG